MYDNIFPVVTIIENLFSKVVFLRNVIILTIIIIRICDNKSIRIICICDNRSIILI